MKRPFTSRLLFVSVSLLLFAARAHAGYLKNWINTSGGSWFDPNNWSPSSVPTNGDAATITNNGTYTVYAPTGTVSCTVFTIGGGTGRQTFVYGSLTGGQLFMTNSSIQNNGALVLTNGGVKGALSVQPGGELDFNSENSLFLYELALTNQGTVTWTNGHLGTGGTSPAMTYITNSGLWQVAAPDALTLSSGGGSISYFYNSGTVQKTSGTGANSLGVTFINLPSGTVNVTSGTLTLSGEGTNRLGGSFTAASPGLMKFTGNESDAGGSFSGTGTFQFTFGNFYARTNIDPNLKLIGGDVYIVGTTTFQQGGAITNLTLDGANLHGTNRIVGSVTVNSGNVQDYVTVMPTGQLLYTGSSQLYYTPLLMNLGTVVCSGSSLSFCYTIPTVISNGGTWTMTADTTLNSGGSPNGFFTNAGVVQKIGGTGNSTFSGYPFVNLPSGVIRAASGTLLMPFQYTNAAGEVKLAGGMFGANFSSTNGMTGGILDGAGTNSTAAIFDGGTVSPGPGAAAMQFKAGLTLGTNCTLSLDGTGTVPGVSYDQISVVGGTLTISNATLQVTSLPSVPVGTQFVIITNATINPVIGTFNGLPENAPLTISSQPFRIHYSGGHGNDVVLVRDAGGPVTGPQLSNGGYTNRTFKLLGVGSGSTIYSIQASTNLLQWANVGFATGDIGGNFIFTDTNATNFRYRFYRTTN